MCSNFESSLCNVNQLFVPHVAGNLSHVHQLLLLASSRESYPGRRDCLALFATHLPRSTSCHIMNHDKYSQSSPPPSTAPIKHNTNKRLRPTRHTHNTSSYCTPQETERRRSPGPASASPIPFRGGPAGWVTGLLAQEQRTRRAAVAV